jgi:hypothetical protein
MHIDRPTTKGIIQCHFTLLLLLWWGGLNCLTGCLSAPTSLISQSHCSMSGDEGGSCCHDQAGSEESRSSKSIGAPFNSSHSLTCCSLESLSGEVKRNVRAVDNLPASAINSRIESSPEIEPRAQHPARWVRLPDRGGTYLFHCVFLI